MSRHLERSVDSILCAAYSSYLYFDFIHVPLPSHSECYVIFRTDSEAEVARLLALLHAREMENLKVLRELEETKAMLALVRAKHSAEMAQAKLVAVEKDLRLQVAEQALQSLKLVRSSLNQLLYFLSQSQLLAQSRNMNDCVVDWWSSCDVLWCLKSVLILFACCITISFLGFGGRMPWLFRRYLSCICKQFLLFVYFLWLFFLFCLFIAFYCFFFFVRLVDVLVVLIDTYIGVEKLLFGRSCPARMLE